MSQLKKLYTIKNRLSKMSIGVELNIIKYKTDLMYKRWFDAHTTQGMTTRYIKAFNATQAYDKMMDQLIREYATTGNLLRPIDIERKYGWN
jgi:hypothetical protein